MKEQPYILIVDDDPDIIEEILMILETQPYRLATARDGKQRMQMVEAEIPDLLILDLLMPRMDGRGVIREMRSNPRFAFVPKMILSTIIGDASRRVKKMKNPAASSGVSFNGKSFMGASPPSPLLPFLTAASGLRAPG